MKLPKQYYEFLEEYKVAEERECTKDEVEQYIKNGKTDIPIFKSNEKKSVVYTTYSFKNYTKEEIEAMLKLNKLLYIRTIKNCLLFLTFFIVFSICILIVLTCA